jgi:hypothetical protein
MESPNIKHVPLNREGAIELGINPCGVCNMGWGNWSKDESKSCYDTCEYHKRYCEGIKVK